jgi:hypothetical protein
MVFDVESIGLYGEAFAVGWVVVNEAGTELGEGLLCCNPSECEGTDANRAWVQNNVPEMPINCNSREQLINYFWDAWTTWAKLGAVLVADCGYPVETGFLKECVMANHDVREFTGPYPLHDLASILLACGRNPLTTNPRLPNELPHHNPLCDARQSKRLLMECWSEIK